MAKPVLGYWNIRALAQPIRYMLAYLGVDYEDKLYENAVNREVWFEQDKFNLGLGFPNIPYWIEGDIRLTESKAILKYLAREKGQDKNLLPVTLEEFRNGDMLEGILWDVWLSLIRLCFTWTDDMKETFNKTAPVKFEQISKLGNNKFLLGNRITYLDFIFYEVIYHFNTFDSNFLKPYQNVVAYKENFESIPEISVYMKSPQHIASPCISSMAKHQI